MLLFTYREMRSKYGFNDGQSEPVNIEEARSALIDLINNNLPEECEVEAYAFDRPGVHNHYLLLYRKKGMKEINTFSHYCGEEKEPKEIHDILYNAEADGELRFCSQIEISRRGL